MPARPPVSDIVRLPLSAMTTLAWPDDGIVTDAGLPAFDHMSSEPDGPTSVSGLTAITLPSPSLMKIAAAEVGSGFGTAIGSEPLLWLSCTSPTRACALILGTNSLPKNQPRFVSVTLTSTYFDVQGEPFRSVLSPAPTFP